MWLRFFVTIILYAPLPVNARTTHDRIAQGMTPNSLTISDESYN